MSGILERFNFYDYEKMDEMLEQAAKKYKNSSKKKSTEIKLAKCPFCGSEVNLVFYCEDAMRTYVNYEEELEELEDVYGFIHCHGCDADFCKTATLRELIDWWNDRVPTNNVISNLKQFEEDYKYETNWGFISQCIEIVEDEL